MTKIFIPGATVRNNALKLAHKIHSDGFVPDIIYVSLRGGAYMGNVISEYFKMVNTGENPVFYAAVVARSYTDIYERDRVQIDGWTYHPKYLRPGDKVLFVDDIFDSGHTINYLVNYIMEKGVSRSSICIAVHDYKRSPDRDAQPIQPDYWCREVPMDEQGQCAWVHYLGHELEGLTDKEIHERYINEDPELAPVFDSIKRARSGMDDNG